MTPFELNLVLFIAVVVAFAWIGFSSARREKTIESYFHSADLHKNVISLAASNISLGTGLVYLVSGAQQNGLLMLLPVIGVCAGYWLLAEFLERATSVSARSGRNFLASLDAEIETATGERSLFAKSVSLSLVLIFVLLLAFEIFASAKVVAPFLFESPTMASEVILATGIFLITVFYALLGGVKAIFGVDALQVPLICLFIPAFVVAAIPDWNHPSIIAERLAESLKVDRAVLVGVAIACVNSVATQFYSLLNWGAVSNVELAQQKRLLRWVGSITASVLVLFVLVGLLHPIGSTGSAWQDLVQQFSTLGATGGAKSYILFAVIMLGMASILLTTTDAVVVNCVLFSYDNLVGGNSKSSEDDPKALRKIRLIGAVMFGSCFAVLCAIHYLQPDPFYLLLSMAGGVVVFAPMIATAGYLAKCSSALYVFSRRNVSIFVALFVCSGVADVILLSRKSSFVPYIGLIAFVLAASFCGLLIAQSKSRRVD